MRSKAAAAEYAAKMLELVSEWRSSGMSRVAFCRERNIKPHVLSYWKSRSETARVPSPSALFVGLPEEGIPSSKERSPSMAPYELCLSWVKLRLQVGFSVEQATALILSLRDL